MEEFNKWITKLDKTKFFFKFCTNLEENFTKERREIISKLLGDRENYEITYRLYGFLLPWDLAEGYLIDEHRIYLFPNGVCIIYYDYGNVEQSINDHRIGVYEESDKEIKIRSISIWKNNSDIEENLYLKNDENCLFFKHDTSNCHIVDKIMSIWS